MRLVVAGGDGVVENLKVSGAVVTHSVLVSDLTALGVAEGSMVLAHTRMSALGWVVGGAPTVVDALGTVLGQEGTLLVLTGWDDRPPYHQDGWSEAERDAYRRECPPFDPLKSRAEVAHGRVPEAVRTWPGASHSPHPVDGFAVIGADAGWVVSGQSLGEGYGADSPLARLVEREGAVLLLGAPLESVTLLHYAEYRAAVEPKRWVEYEMPVRVEGNRVWRKIRELDSSLGAFAYDDLHLDEDAFAAITRSALSAGIGRSGTVGAADAHLLPAAELVDHAVAWIELNFVT